MRSHAADAAEAFGEDVQTAMNRFNRKTEDGKTEDGKTEDATDGNEDN
jgi:hypothetical protein